MLQHFRGDGVYEHMCINLAPELGHTVCVPPMLYSHISAPHVRQYEDQLTNYVPIVHKLTYYRSSNATHILCQAEQIPKFMLNRLQSQGNPLEPYYVEYIKG